MTTIARSEVLLCEARFYAFHGVMPQERKVGAEYTVSVTVGYDYAKAAESDEVDDTLNYAELYELVKHEMQQPSKLLEHVALRMGEAIFQKWSQAAYADIRVIKNNPPMGAACAGAGVNLHLVNDKTKKC